MFGHNFKYTFKVLMRNRMLLFWTFVFPLVLGTMFKLAFSNIENSEKLNVIPIAIVDNEDFQGNEAFRRTFETLSDESSDEQMFDTVYVSKDEADTLLSDGDVDGVLYMNGAEPEIWIHENGINQTVLQYVVDEIVHTSAIMEKRVQNEIEQGTMPDIEALYKDVMEQVAGRESNLVDASRKNLSYTMIESPILSAVLQRLENHPLYNEIKSGWHQRYLVWCNRKASVSAGSPLRCAVLPDWNRHMHCRRLIWRRMDRLAAPPD